MDRRTAWEVGVKQSLRGPRDEMLIPGPPGKAARLFHLTIKPSPLKNAPQLFLVPMVSLFSAFW